MKKLKEGYFVKNDTKETADKMRDFFSGFEHKFKFNTYNYFNADAYYGILNGKLTCLWSNQSSFKEITVVKTLEELLETPSLGSLGNQFRELKKTSDTNTLNSYEKTIEKGREISNQTMRQFETGATRNIDVNKYDYEGFLSPLVIEEFAKYMHKNRLQADGQLRDSDNWQKGIPIDAYMKSMWRHFFDTWKNHRGIETPEDQISNLCGLMFNVQGMLHELIKKNGTKN